MVDDMTAAVSPAGPTLDPDRPQTENAAPLRAVHTTNFSAILRQRGASLLVTTYQAGKLVLVCDEGDHLNVHFRAFQAPMGMALSGDRLAIGTKIQVWEEVFAVTVLTGRRYPDLINDDERPLENSFVVPDAALADVPASLRGPAEPTPGAAGSGGNGSGPRVPFGTA
jgi:hypothetical protein